MTTALVVHQLKKTYRNGVSALKGIDLTVDEGDFFALLGKNGAGKSTTIGIISSLITKTSGAIRIFGYDMDSALKEAKSFIGIVPQEMNFNLFDKISQILINQAGYYGIPRSIAIDRMEEYLTVMGLWDMRHATGFQLSGGMKRRLLIARAMMNKPRLLILDEPTAGVDIELRHLLWKFLQRLNAEGTTIILTTHYLEEAEHLCKHLAIIDQGLIIERANVKSLMTRLKVQTFILELQQSIVSLPLDAPFYLHQADDRTLEAKLREGETVNDLFVYLNQHNIKVSSMRNKSNRLEEIFIHLTESKT